MSEIKPRESGSLNFVPQQGVYPKKGTTSSLTLNSSGDVMIIFRTGNSARKDIIFEYDPKRMSLPGEISINANEIWGELKEKDSGVLISEFIIDYLARNCFYSLIRREAMVVLKLDIRGEQFFQEIEAFENSIFFTSKDSER